MRLIFNRKLYTYYAVDLERYCRSGFKLLSLKESLVCDINIVDHIQVKVCSLLVMDFNYNANCPQIPHAKRLN
jgi:hypothetical protein